MREYEVNIKEVSKELSRKEALALKQGDFAIKLDTATRVEPVDIDVDYYAVLSVHNEKSENKDYELYVIVDKEGQSYTTGSPSFWRSFMEIWDTMTDDSFTGEPEPWKVRVSRRPSKNREGKDFLIATII